MQTHPVRSEISIADHGVSRREFVARCAAAALTAAATAPAITCAQAATAPQRLMKICLTPGSIGVSASQTEAIALAAKYGFEAVEPFGNALAALSDDQISGVQATLKEKNLVWGSSGLTVDFRQEETKFTEGMRALPKVAAALRRAGVKRLGTWIGPASEQLTYLQNLRQHARRLREAATVLKDHGLRLGLEYVGTQTLRNSRKYPFVHTMAETKELIAEIGTGNVGFVLDSWHWWTAGDTPEDILALKNDEVMSVDLNDAPAGVPKDQQIDGRRELPCATGVIDVAAFLNALQRIGYDGPVRAEPFNKPLNDLDNEAACETTIKAMRKAFDLIG